MNIFFFFEDVKKIDLEVSNDKQWILNCIKKYKKITGSINFIFCSDTYLLEINRKYLNHNYYTDIITFDYCEGDVINGDIYISIDRVEDNSKKFNSVFSIELHRVMIHGVLHLVGLKDSTEEEKLVMRNAENLCLNSM